MSWLSKYYFYGCSSSNIVNKNFYSDDSVCKLNDSWNFTTADVTTLKFQANVKLDTKKKKWTHGFKKECFTTEAGYLCVTMWFDGI